jgi:hypothetical protein
VFHHSTTAAAVAAAAKTAVKNSAKRPEALRSRPSSGGSKLDEAMAGGGLMARLPEFPSEPAPAARGAGRGREGGPLPVRRSQGRRMPAARRPRGADASRRRSKRQSARIM